MWTRSELIALVLERERSAPKPPEPNPEPNSQRPHPMIEITARIRAEKLRQFYAQVKRRS
jgi:hypothetical protein